MNYKVRIIHLISAILCGLKMLEYQQFFTITGSVLTRLKNATLEICTLYGCKHSAFLTFFCIVDLF
jgi:hypothetical protein